MSYSYKIFGGSRNPCLKVFSSSPSKKCNGRFNAPNRNTLLMSSSNFFSTKQQSFIPTEPSRPSSDLTKNACADDRETGSNFYDIIIAGGGLVGTALAVALGSSRRLSNKRILLLESSQKFWTKPPETCSNDNGTVESNFSNRVVALSPGSQALLSSLGIWKDVWRSQPVSSLQVWEALSDAHINFNYPDYSSPVAYIVENPVLAHAICESLKRISSVDVMFGSRVKSCGIPEEGSIKDKAYVILENDQKLKTDLLIGADGFNSKVRSSIFSPTIKLTYDRMAVVATLKLNETLDNRVAWQKFLPGGPIALLPLAPNYSSLVWSTTPAHANEILKMSSDDFVDAVNSAYWKEYNQSELVKKSFEWLTSLNLSKGARIFPPSVVDVIDKSRANFPLGCSHSAYYATTRAVLIGDAAHRVHPLAGQGLNLGFGDVRDLENVLSETVGLGEDIGSFDCLREYETRRQRHNVAIQSGVDLLHRLYSTETSPIVALRSLGLSIVNSSKLIKTCIMNHSAV